jgi:rhomboid protease GluP
MYSATTGPPADQRHEFLLRLNAATPRIVVTPTLLAGNIGLFLVMAALGINILGGRTDEYLRFGANFAPLTTGGEWWRLIACTFVHLGILHLAFNMWALWDCGRLTERLFGNVWFAVVYLFAGVAGGFASMLWNPQAISVGASGAVFGVFGALLAYITMRRGAIPPEVMNRLRVSTSVFVTYSLFYGFAQTGIDNAAHLGGLAGGFVMGLIAARPLDPQPRRAGNARRALFAALLAGVLLPAAAWLMPDTARIYRQAIDLQNQIEAFTTEEKRLSSAFQSIVDQTRTAKLSDDDALKEMRTKILPAWDDAVARLARIELDAKAPARKDYELLMRYAVARRDMIKAVADTLESGDPEHEKMIAELRMRAEVALKQYQERQKK